MNILYVSNEYPPDTGFGGIATYTRQIARGMVRLGHTVHVICRSVNKTDTMSSDEGVTVHRTVCGSHPLPRHRLWYPLRMICYMVIPQSLHRLAWAKTAWKKYHELCNSISFDLIEYPECGAEGFYFTRKRVLPSVVRLHTPWTLVRYLDKIKEHPLDCFLQVYLERSTITRSRARSSPSVALSVLVKKKWHTKAANVFPNPIDSGDYRTGGGAERWIYTGRLEYRKGVHHLIEAYAFICRTLSPPPLLLVGCAVGVTQTGEPYGSHIRKLIDTFQLDQKITHLPGVSHQEIPALLENSSAAFFPSLWENFPYSCLEAMASGLTVAASRCGGYPEMIEEGTSGLLFDAQNCESLAQSMTWILENPQDARAMGRRAKIRVRGLFDSEVVCLQAQSFYVQTSDARLRV